jgi:hypothetical protein
MHPASLLSPGIMIIGNPTRLHVEAHLGKLIRAHGADPQLGGGQRKEHNQSDKNHYRQHGSNLMLHPIYITSHLPESFHQVRCPSSTQPAQLTPVLFGIKY